MKAFLIHVLFNLPVIGVNAQSDVHNSTLCIFVHGLGWDWKNSEEGVHDEDEEHLETGTNSFFWNFNMSVNDYWRGLDDRMIDRGICNETYITKYDTVTSSMDELKVTQI